MLVLAVPQACLCSLVSGLGKRPEVEGQTGIRIFFLCPRESWSSVTTLASYHSYKTGFCRGRKVQSRTWAHWNQSDWGWAGINRHGHSALGGQPYFSASAGPLALACYGPEIFWLLCQSPSYSLVEGLDFRTLFLQIIKVSLQCALYANSLLNALHLLFVLSEFNPSFCDRGCILFILQATKPWSSERLSFTGLHSW